MATDCERLSKNARIIFEEIKPFFLPNPWGKSQWRKEGKVYSNGRLDLRKSADRDRLEKFELEVLAGNVRIKAKMYQDKNGSLEGFENECFSKFISRHVGLLLLLQELDCQIEMGDLVDSVCS